MKKTELPMVSRPKAEKILRDIARREGEAIKKRRSRTLIEHFGDGYMVYEPNRNFVISGCNGFGGAGQDGCGNTLADLAARYEEKANTSWQRIVLASVKAGRVSE
jgi:hypothetical protein